MKQKTQFAICLNNKGYKASLEVGKLYRVIRDQQAEDHGLVRVVDETGEDYAFAANRFASMDVPPAVQKVLLSIRP
jgi:hypothetical protein